MIPRFNARGYLPNGIHLASLDEIARRFGSSSGKRKELMRDLKKMIVMLLKEHKGFRLLLDGSFISEKLEPQDIDAILILRTDFSEQAMEQLANAKELFHTHLFTLSEGDKPALSGRIDFFGHDRSEFPKGLVEVAL